MKGQFFVVATVIMIIALMSLVRYFYSFSDIGLSKIKEINELEYIPFIKDSLSGTLSTFNGDCSKLRTDLNNTKILMENEMIRRGIYLNVSYQLNCPPATASFNVTMRTANLHTETLFNYP